MKDYIDMMKKLVILASLFIAAATCGAKTIVENPRRIPVAQNVDVVVIGGSTRAVAAAIAAKENGASVFLVAQRPYLGADLCATWRLWLEKDEKPFDELTRSIFGDDGSTTPMNVKLKLDQALLDADIPFLYGSYVTDILQDEKSKPAGIIMANRSGRQAVIAKVVIDATHRGIVARLAGAEFKPYPTGKQTFRRIVIGGEPSGNAQLLEAKVPQNSKKKTQASVYEYTLELDMKDSSWRSFAKADQSARDKTWHDNQIAASEQLFQVPPDPVIAIKSQTTPLDSISRLDLDALRPKGTDRIYVLSGSADLSRENAEMILQPLDSIQLGRRVGIAAAKETKKISKPNISNVSIQCSKAKSSGELDVGEMLNGLRSRAPMNKQSAITSPSRQLPVLAEVDVVVAGGGTGGAPAAISAARAKAKTLLIEYLHGLGGVGTMGKIARYWHGNRVGFTKEIDKAVGGGNWNIEKKMEWYRKEIVKAGGEIWFQSLVCGSVSRGSQIVGIVVATPFGRGVVLANTVIDSTGNAVIAACAGLPTMQIDADHISVQGTGLPPNIPGGGYFNSDWTFADDDDVIDMWRMFVVGKSKHKDKYDMGQLIDTRARRRIIGDIVITPMDIVNKRKFPDTITVAKSNFDNHGFSTHTLFMITPPHMKSLTGHIPYRALMPKGSDGLLTTGLGISAHGDAMPVLRMQPDVQNQGYAAGKAAAMAACENTTVRSIDVKQLQKHLVDVGILDEERLSDKDSYPISLEDMNKAVKSIGMDYQGISRVLVDPKKALPMLRQAYKSSSSKEEKLRYAHVLGMLYDDTGAENLIDAVKSSQWDKGWRFRGMGQFGRTTSYIDNLIIALARTGDKRAIPVVIEKLKALTAESELSHYRAVAIFFELHRDPAAAKPLAELLNLPGMTGHAFIEIKDEIKRTPQGTSRNGSDNSTRRNSLPELILARALYRCGDYNGLAGNILKTYAKDLRGHYAAHAKAILNEGASFTFVQICDTQLGMGGYDHDVQTFKQTVDQVNASKADFAVICGDLVSRPDERSLTDFNAIKSKFNVPCYCVPGNHDVGNKPTLESLKKYRKQVGKDYYSFEHKGYVFICLNTSLFKSPVEGESEKQDLWLKDYLRAASSKNKPIFIVGHHPLYIKQVDEPEAYFNLPVAKRKELLNLFEKHGVVAVLTGHTHNIVINEHNGIQLVTGQATSRVFGGSLGFRLWHITGQKPFKHESVNLEGF